MRSNKINNADLFTSAANDKFSKHIKTQSKQALETIKATINWSKLLKPIEEIITKEKQNNSPAGRRIFDLLVIVKCFILQSIYNLSDPRLEEEIADRRSFQIFLDINSNDSIPDETTICRYREIFARLDLDKKLFNEFNKQLKSLNLIVAKGTSSSSLYVMNTNGSSLVDVTNKLARASSPFWSVNDELFVMVEGQLYKYNLETGDSKQITDFYAGVSDPIVSNNGRYVAFTSDLFPECGTDNECNKKLDKSSLNGPVQAYIADELLFRHWTEYKGEKETYLVLYDTQTKEYQTVVSSDVLSRTYMLGGGSKYAFSPDSRILSYVATPEKNIVSSTNTDIYLLPLGGKDAVSITVANNAWDGGVVFSPDGKYLAYKTHLIPGFEADRFRIAIYNIQTLQSETLTESFDFTTDDIIWSSDSKSIYFTANAQGYNPVYKVDIQTKNITKVTDDKSVAGYQVSKDQKFLYLTFSSVDKPKEIYSYDIDGSIYSQITFYNKKFIEEVDVRNAEQTWIDGADGVPVHVFIVKPHGFDPTKKYPLVINVHGGPQTQWMDSFRGDWQIYAGSGYVTAFFNPHGSTGYGSKYTESISKDWGGKVYEDVMKVTDYLSKLSYIDSTKMGAMGWSYGGYMMNWLQAKTKRFKCLASMMGVYDLESMWGSTEELWFANWDFGGQPWNSDIYKKYSPSNYVQNFSTPTLIITGEKDYRVPYTQSIQYFTTLQSLGIDSRLIVFKNDGH